MRAKILVTGGSGLLGSALKEVCPEARFIDRRDGDLRDLAQTEKIFAKFKPESVLHLAAAVGGVKANAAKNADFFTENILINTNVLAAAQRAGVLRLISVLSSCAYAVYDNRPSYEDDLHGGLPFGGNLGYGYSKRALDIQTRLMWEQYGCRFTTVTPVTMYGPNDHFDLDNSHVLAALILKCRRAKLENKSLEVWGTGNAVRQFIYAADVARILVRLLERIRISDTLIIAPDEGLTVRELTEKVAKAMQFSGPIVYDPAKPEGQTRRVLKSRRFAEAFPDFDFMPFEKGLEKTINWFLKNHKN